MKNGSEDQVVVLPSSSTSPFTFCTTRSPLPSPSSEMGTHWEPTGQNVSKPFARAHWLSETGCFAPTGRWRPVTAHVVEGVALGDPPAAGRDLDAQLGFRVHVRRLGRKHDRLARPISVFSNLPKRSGDGRVVAELGGVLGVVAPDADDLHGPILPDLI